MDRIRRDLVIPLLLFTACAILLSLLSVLKYATFNSEWAFDLAFFNNLFHNTVQGNPFHQSVNLAERDGLIKLSHFYPIILLYVPFYKLFPHISTLLILQSSLIATGVIPLYLIIRRGIPGVITPLLLIITLLIHPPFFLTWLADFRPILLFIPLFLWLFYALETERPLLALVALLLSLASREEVPFLLLPLPFFLLFTKRERWRWFCLTLFPIVLYLPTLVFMRGAFSDYINYSASLFDMAGADLWNSFLANPETLRRAKFIPFTLLFPSIYPSILAPEILLLGIPAFLYLFPFSTYSWAVLKGPYLHHLTVLVPLFMVAFVKGTAKLSSLISRQLPGSVTLARTTSGIVLALFILESLFIGLRLDNLRRQYLPYTFEDNIFRARGVWRMINLVPDDAVVATDYTLIAALSGRGEAHVYNYGMILEGDEGSAVIPEGGERRFFLKDLDYILLASEDEDTLPLEEHGFSLIARGAGYLLYRRDTP